MKDHDLAAKLPQDHFTATAALVALMLKDLPEFVRVPLDAVRNGSQFQLGTGFASMTIELTKLENDVMQRMLTPFVAQESLAVVAFLKDLHAVNRSLSADALDGSKCCGFYVHFEGMPFPINVSNLPPRLSVRAQREGLPFGADFILFLTPDHHLRFLEGTFYGCSIPSIELSKDDHGFSFS